MADERDQLALFRLAGSSTGEPAGPAGTDPSSDSERPNQSSLSQILHGLGVSDDDPIPEDGFGDLHQLWLESRGVRKSQGSYYTPADVVTGLVELALGPVLASRRTQGVDAVASLRVIDPACGSGNFLLAVARRINKTLVELGMDPTPARHHAYGRCVAGVDLDRDAVEICRFLLHREGQGAISHQDVEDRVLVADALTVPLHDSPPVLDGSEPELSDWPSLLALIDASEGFDLVVGNPPFLSQLSSDTSRSTAYASELLRRFGPAASGYADPAALFLLLASEIAKPNGGVVTLIQPISTLSTRDAQPVRQTILSKGSMTALWIADQRVFDADVDVFAPVITLGGTSTPTGLVVGRTFQLSGSEQPPGPDEPTWSSLLATSRGVPRHDLRTAGLIGDVAEATADFRDQYYGLAPHVIDLCETDSSRRPPLITAGLIDPAHVRWGDAKVKFNKTSYQYPRVKLDDLPGKLRDWANSRLVPKILLATQTRILEAAVDPSGQYLPSVPVITITSNKEDLWKLAALLVSPPITLVALRRHLGAALSADALKLGGRDVLNLPLPPHQDPWEEAGLEFKKATNTTSGSNRRSHLIDSGRLMCEAYRVSDSEELVEWWTRRLPRVRDAA